MAVPRRRLLVVTLALLGGQLLGGLPRAPLIAANLAGAASLVVGRRRPHGTWLAVCLCAAAVGALQVAALLAPRLPPEHVAHRAGDTIEASARVEGSVRDAAGRTRLTLALDATIDPGGKRPAQGRALVTLATATLPWQPGDRVQARLRLRRPRNFGNPGEFDYEAFLARRGIYVTAFAMSDAGWQRNPASAGPRSWVTRWRAAIRAVLSQSLGGPAAAITAALIIGDAAPLSPEVRERYARSGVAHILSISGLHIGLVAAAGYGTARWLMSRSLWLLLATNVPKLSMAAAVLPVGLYGLLAGGSAPTLRAITVIMVFALGILLNRRRDWLTSLAAAALVLSLLWPGAVFEIGFQLSFMSVLAIMIGMPPIAARWRAWEETRLVRLRPDAWRWRLVRAIVLTAGTTTCAAVGTAPLTAYHFNQVSLITLVANLLVIPLLGLAPITTGLLASLCVPIAPAAAAGLFQIGGLFIGCADWLVTILAQVPGAALRTVTPTIFELALLYGMLGSAFLPSGRARTVVVVGCAVVLIGDAAYWYRERFHSDRLRVTFLSVGQGDCAVIEFPGSAVMVVDGGGMGGTFDVGARIVAPYLWRRKIARLDLLVLSHAEHDHYGGLDFLARSFAPRALWWNGIDGSGRRWQEFARILDRHAVPMAPVRRGQGAVVGSVRLDVLAPDAGDPGSLNDRSLVLRLSYGNRALLFTGDVEAEGERRLLTRVADGVRADILKAAHHGSRTSSSDALLAGVSPSAAVISTAFANRFRMPHPEVLARYHARGIAVWRTDEDGAVVVTIAPDGALAISGTRPRPAL